MSVAGMRREFSQPWPELAALRRSHAKLVTNLALAKSAPVPGPAAPVARRLEALAKGMTALRNDRHDLADCVQKIDAALAKIKHTVTKVEATLELEALR